MHHRSAACGALTVVASLCLWFPLAAGAAASTVTIAEGKNAILSGAAAYVPAAGVRLNPCDIVRTGPQGLVQVESEDGSQIVLGPDTTLVFDLPIGGYSVIGPHFLIAGWVKITVPKREKAPPYRIDTSHFDLSTDAGVAVLRAAADGAEFYVEQGNAAAQVGSSTRVAVATGRTYSHKSGQGRGTLSERAKPTFVDGMPRAFRDTLPSLLAQMKAGVQARPASDFSASDAREWLKAAPELRACVASVTVRSAQESLQRNGLEVGPLDGILGPRTQAALREYQQKRGLPASGRLDAETLQSLDVVDRR